MKQESTSFESKSKQIMLCFIHDALKISSDNKELLIEEDEFYPELKNGQYYRTISRKIKNFDYFVKSSISKKLEELNSFELLNLALSEQPIKTYYQNFNKQKNLKIPQDVQEMTKIIPKNIFVDYLKLQKNFEFNESNFNLMFKHFIYFTKNVHADEYIMPMYNFKSNTYKKSLKFVDITLRQITEYELKIISNMGERKEISNLNKKLTHVVSIFWNSKDLESGFENSEKELKYFINTLILNFTGDLRLATIYQNINYHWKQFEIGSKINLDETKNILSFSESEYSVLNNFYRALKKSDIENKENEFVKMAINRFQIGINRSSIVDKIIDFNTSLESLYSSGKGDITRKLSQRCCMVVGTTDEEHEYYHNFIKKAYSFRSGLVHGEGNRELQVDGKTLSVNDVSEILEDITRNSIKKYLKLIKHYSGKEKNAKIIQDIDTSLVNRKKYILLKKKF